MGTKVTDYSPAIQEQIRTKLSGSREDGRCAAIGASPASLHDPASERAAEAFDVAVGAHREIKDMHDPFCVWLNRNGIGFTHANPTAKSTIAKGHPDFECWRDGKICFVEFKILGKEPRKDQRERIAEIAAKGCKVCVAHSLREAIDFVRANLENNA